MQLRASARLQRNIVHRGQLEYRGYLERGDHGEVSDQHLSTIGAKCKSDFCSQTLEYAGYLDLMDNRVQEDLKGKQTELSFVIIPDDEMVH